MHTFQDDAGQKRSNPNKSWRGPSRSHENSVMSSEWERCVLDRVCICYRGCLCTLAWSQGFKPRFGIESSWSETKGPWIESLAWPHGKNNAKYKKIAKGFADKIQRLEITQRVIRKNMLEIESLGRCRKTRKTGPRTSTPKRGGTTGRHNGKTTTGDPKGGKHNGEMIQNEKCHV